MVHLIRILVKKKNLNPIMEKWIMPYFWYNGGGGVVAKSCLTLETPWTGARQDPLSMGFPRQE